MFAPARAWVVLDDVWLSGDGPQVAALCDARHYAPTLVLSGVNRGANLAEDVTYSGTIAGAFEGATLGIRSIALSLAYGIEPGKGLRWETAIAHGPALIRKLLALEWDAWSVMNVNFPDCDPDKVAGISITEQGRRDPGMLAIDERMDTWGTPYYWLAFKRRRSNAPSGTDLSAIYANRISVTPLYLNLTHRALRTRLQETLGTE